MHHKLLSAILSLILCAAFASCAQPTGVTEIAEDFGDEPLPTVMMRDELCAQTRSIRDEMTTHDEFALWASTNPVERAGDLPMNARQAAIVYADSQQAINRNAKTQGNSDFILKANISLRNVSFELMEIYCDPEGNFGNTYKACPLWDSHRNGGLSSRELYETFVGDVGAPDFWDGYTVESSLLFFAYEYARRVNDGQDTRMSRIEEMFASACGPK